MLTVNKYSQAYVDECREKVTKQLDAFNRLVATADQNEKALATFETVFFNHLVVLLDALFVHRSTSIEGEDGNPLNEVRLLCNSILTSNGNFTPEEDIQYNPLTSVLKLKPGEEIRLNPDSFSRLSEAFFDEMQKKYV